MTRQTSASDKAEFQTVLKFQEHKCSTPCHESKKSSRSLLLVKRYLILKGLARRGTACANSQV
jgi:hypothetical protein